MRILTTYLPLHSPLFLHTHTLLIYSWGEETSRVPNYEIIQNNINEEKVNDLNEQREALLRNHTPYISWLSVNLRMK